jgi:hypothetical protein
MHESLGVRLIGTKGAKLTPHTPHLLLVTTPSFSLSSRPMCHPSPTRPSRGGLAGVRPAHPLRRGLAPGPASEAAPTCPPRRAGELASSGGHSLSMASVLRKKKDILVFVQPFSPFKQTPF